MALFLIPFITHADLPAVILDPANPVTTCGEMAAPGTYTLSADIQAPENSTCFLVSSDSVIIDGAGHTVTTTGTTSVAIDTKAWTRPSTLTNGANAYTDLTVYNINLTGFATGIDARGNNYVGGVGENNTSGGSGGDVYVYYASIGNIKTDGGSSSQAQGGLGGDISITATDLNLATSTISAIGGINNSGNFNLSGGLTLTYTGSSTTTKLALSKLSFLNINGTTYSNYPGGSIPITNTSVSTCGTLYSATTTTFSISQNLISSGTCFTIFGDNITIEGNGHTITHTSSSTDFAIQATENNYTNLTISNLDFIGYENAINSDLNLVLRSDGALNLSGEKINALQLSIQTIGEFLYSQTTVSNLSSLILNGKSYGAALAGLLTNIVNVVKEPIFEPLFWSTVVFSDDGQKVVAGETDGYIYTSSDGGVTWVKREGAGSAKWNSLAVSANGNKIVALSGDFDYLAYSEDGGETWGSYANISGYFNFVSMSDDGQKIIVAHEYGEIQVSIDGGLSWSSAYPAGSRMWSSVKYSGDGSKIIAAARSDYVYTSSDDGQSWATYQNYREWTKVDVSNDGNNMIASCNYDGYIYISNNGGQSWTEITAAGPGAWTTVSVSGDGTKYLAAGDYDYVLVSDDAFSSWTQIDELSAQTWIGSDINYDGSNMLVFESSSGKIYTSLDSGVNWTRKGVVSEYFDYASWVQRPSAGARAWRDLSSSADGSKLVAAVSNGYIYISSDKGNTWATSTSAGLRSWQSVSVSADGMKIYATNYGGYIYSSVDGGTTWVENANAGIRNWSSISVTSDGMKIAAVVSNGYIYTSADGGITWIERRNLSVGYWNEIVYSLSGNKLIVLNSTTNKVFVSVDDGGTWNEITNIGNPQSWLSVAMSSDGEKIALAGSGYVYTSIDGGDNWIQRSNLASDYWYNISSSADGSILTTISFYNRVHTSNDFGDTWFLDETFYLGANYTQLLATSYDGSLTLAADVNNGYLYTRSINTNTAKIISMNMSPSDIINVWSPYVIWINAASCYYSYDNWSSSSTVNCLLNGSDIIAPISQGLHTLYLKALGFGGLVEKIIEFTYSSSGIKINNPVSGVNYQNNNWNPSIDYDVSNSKTITSCSYSYDNFINSTTTNCALSGSDILPPFTQGSSTLSIKAIDSENNEYIKSVSINYYFPWVEYSNIGVKNWSSVAVSSSGNKIVGSASASGGPGNYIYTSADSGATWIERTLAGGRDWRAVSSSADGEVLIGAAYNNYIYTSSNGGSTWTTRSLAGSRTWVAVDTTSNGDGIIAAATMGYLYTSINNGSNWTERTSLGTKAWSSVAVTASGSKYIAAVQNGYVYTSSDGGTTWATSTGAGSRNWISVSTSDDGLKIAAAAVNNYIYVSSDGGTTWATSTGAGSKNWRSVAVSSTGLEIIAVVYGGYVYESLDGGLTWIENIYAGSRSWNSVAISSDSSKYVASVVGGYIYSKNNNQDKLSLNISSPTPNSFVSYTTWLPSIDWSLATNCYYSYDNWVSTSTVDCSLNGSDILAPISTGVVTLYIKATNSGGNVFSNSVVFNYIGNSELWSTINSDARNWRAIAASADGSKLVAVVNPNGYIYTSSDGGITWIPRTSIGVKNWSSVAASADGSKMAAAVSSGGYIYISNDSGVTWATSTNSGSRDWRSVTMSVDGAVINASVYGGNIYTSTTTGSTWVPRTNAGSRYWTYVAGSADGSKLVAVVQSGYLYLSTDGGLNWTQKTTLGTKNWALAASSFDGSVLVAAVSNDYIYTSVDGGANWVTRTGAGARNWGSLTLSSDGQKILATVNYGGYIYTSSDGGSNWVETSGAGLRSWSLSESSFDGRIVFTGVNNQYLYKNILNYPVSIENIYPLSSTTISTWTPHIYWSSANTCSYSYNNFVSEITANCSLGGSDVTSPEQSGTYTLYTKGVDAQNNTDIASSTFTIQSKYFCGTIDSDWGNLSNWYTNNTCTTPSASLPSSSTPIVELIGNVSPVIESGDTLPWVINTNGLTGSASSTGVIFSGTSVNTKRIVGNATFRNYAYNSAVITGNAKFESAASSILNLVNSMKWAGTIIGAIAGGDDTLISQLIFNNSSINEGIFTGSAIFNDASNNLGTINGNAVFNNTSSFSMGTVNGTSTLGGISQIITGTNNVQNLYKNASSRDVLYISPTGSINVSGNLTLNGLSGSNLLTISSLSSNQYATLNINGTYDLNNLKIINIHNSGTNAILTNKVIYDGGGNSGFTFASNASNGAGSLVSRYVPSAPIVNNGGNNNNNNNNNNNTNNTNGASGGSTGSFFSINPNLINKLNLSNIPKFDLNLNSDLGFSKFVNPLANLVQLQPLNEFLPIPKINIQPQIVRFMNSAFPKSIADLIKAIPSIDKKLNKANIFSGYDLYTRVDSPVTTPTANDLIKENNSNPSNLLFVAINGINKPTVLKLDKKGNMYQSIVVSSYDSLDVSIRANAKNVKAIFNKKKNGVSNNGNLYTTKIMTSREEGKYLLTLGESTLEIVVKNVEKPQVTSSDAEKRNPQKSSIQKLWSWFSK